MTPELMVLLTKITEAATQQNVAIAQMQKDIKELQDTTGISFERWNAERKEQNNLYIRDRIEYYRSQGEGMMAGKVLAVKDLREKHRLEKLKS